MKLKKAMSLATAAIMAVSMMGTSAVYAGNVTSNTNTETADQVDKVVFALNSSSFDMSPYASNSIPRMWMCQNIYASLFCTPYYGATLEELQPWLAKGYEKVDDLTYKVELYDYIKDSKGNSITSEDVVFAYEKMASTGGETRINTYLDNIEVVDDYNMIFHLKKSGPGVLEFLFGNYTLNICNKE